jgi:CubicO group peptidase (beta-lactamase class C family)
MIFVFLPGTVLANASAPDDLTDFVNEGMQLWNVPGMAVAVVSGNEVLYEQGFGSTAIKDGKEVDKNTLFAIASTTKAMLTAGIMVLVDEEKLALDDLAIKYIPELHFGDASMGQQITVRDLMTHRTGLASTDFWTFGQGMPLDEQILMLQNVEPSASLRAKFQYQNTMYELLGLIIENVSGQQWGDFLKQRLWKPIGMDQTYDSRSDMSEDEVNVLPYDYLDGELVQQSWDFDADLADAAGSVWSSIADMGRWAQFLLRDGVTESGDRLISETSIAEIFKPQMLIEANNFYPASNLSNPNWMSYGLAWFQQDFQGRKIDFHTGSLSGLIAIIGLDRANDLGVIVLANRDHAEMRHAILWHVMDQTQADEQRDWNAEVWEMFQGFEKQAAEHEQKTKDSRLKGTRLSLPEADYTGTYHSDTLGNVEIVKADKGLFMKSAKLKISLSHWHLDTFKAEIKDQKGSWLIAFSIGSDGKVSGFDSLGDEFKKQAGTND